MLGCIQYSIREKKIYEKENFKFIYSYAMFCYHVIRRSKEY